MKAAVFSDGRVAHADFESPSAVGGREVLDVEAAALTRLDMVVASGKHYFKPPAGRFVVGREGVGRRADGRRVYFNVLSTDAPFGSMAQQTRVDPAWCFEVADGCDSATAAALGNAGLAAWLPLSWRARMKPGETVLILGATGVSGLLAVSSAKALGAGRIIAAGRSLAALERARACGAEATVVLDATDPTAAFQSAAGGAIDVVLDYLSGAYAEAALPLLATGGRLVHIGSTVAPTFTLNGGTLRRASIDVLGFAYYHAPVAEQAQAFTRLCEQAVAGRLALDTEVLPLSAIADAWNRQAGGHPRRFVLVPD